MAKSWLGRTTQARCSIQVGATLEFSITSLKNMGGA